MIKKTSKHREPGRSVPGVEKGVWDSMGLSDLISLLGGVALFLFGMTLMGEGLKKVAGSKLELVLYKLSSRRGSSWVRGSPPSFSLPPPLRSWWWALSTPA